MVAGNQTVNGARSFSLERGSALAPGTRREVSVGAHIPGTSSGPTCVCWRAAATLGRLWHATCLPKVRCHLPPTAHSATKPRQKTALHQDALSTARLGNTTEVLQHPFHQRMFGNVFPNKTISNSRIPNFQNMLCWRNCHEIVENVKLLTSQLFYSVVLYLYYCICNVLLYLRSIQTKSCDFGPI